MPVVRSEHAPRITTKVATPRVCVIVPAYNEGMSVAAVVQSVLRGIPGAAVVVVDDGSTDDTKARAKGAGATVITLPVNLGIGGAVQTGYRYAMRDHYDFCLQIDGDGQHDPQEASRLLRPLVKGEADLVIGSRWLGRGDYIASPSRRGGMRILAGLIRWRTGVRITDPTSGFRAVGRKGIEVFADSYSTDFPEVDSLLVATSRGLRILEVPVLMRQRRYGNSSITGLRSPYYMVRVVLSVLLDGAAKSVQT